MTNPMVVGSIINPIAMGSMINPMAIGSMINPIAIGSMINPMAMGSMINHAGFGVMIDRVVIDSMNYRAVMGGVIVHGSGRRIIDEGIHGREVSLPVFELFAMLLSINLIMCCRLAPSFSRLCSPSKSSRSSLGCHVKSRSFTLTRLSV